MKILGAVWIALGALAGLLALCLLLCLILPARLRVVLEKGQWFLWAGLGPVMLTVWPRKEKKAPRRKKTKEKPARHPAANGEAALQEDSFSPGEGQAVPASVGKPQAPAAPLAQAGERKKQKRAKGRRAWHLPSFSIEALCEYGRLALDSLGLLACTLTLRRLQVHAVIAGEDAAKTAMAYGSAAAAIHLFLPALEEKVSIRRQEIAVECDFEMKSPCVELDIEIAARLGAMLIAGLRVAHRFWKLYRRDE